MRAIERPPGCPVALARVAQDGGVGCPRPPPRACAPDPLRACPRSQGRRPGNGDCGSRTRRSAAMPASAATASARAAAIAVPVSAMMQLETLEAGVIAHAVGEQAVALLHGALEVANARAVAGVEAEDQAVEEAPALGGGAGEEAVHAPASPRRARRTRRARRSRRQASPLMRTMRRAALALRRRRSEPGADIDGARGRMHVRGDGPAAVARRRAPAPGRWRGADRARAPAARLPRASWSCPRRWRRSAPAAPARPRARDGRSYGSS